MDRAGEVSGGCVRAATGAKDEDELGKALVILGVEAVEGVQDAGDVLGLAVEALGQFVRVKFEQGLKDEVGADMAGGVLSFAAFISLGDIQGELAKVLYFGALVDPVLKSAVVPLVEVVVVEPGMAVGGEPVDDLGVGSAFVELEIDLVAKGAGESGNFTISAVWHSVLFAV